jgi:preprotein translocase subunit SecD
MTREVPMIGFSLRALSVVLVVGMIFLPGLAGADPPRVRVELRLAEARAGDGLTEAKVAGSDQKVYLHKDAILTNADLDSARVSSQKTRDGGTIPAIEITLTEAGAEKARKATEDKVGNLLAIVIDGKVVAGPTLRAAVGEKVLITGKFSREQLDQVVEGINGM